MALALAAACLFLLTRTTQAAVRLADAFGDHMVLPAGVPVAIWGTNAPGGDTVRVSIAGQTAVAKSDWEGRWMVQLKPMKAGGPYQMLIEVGGLGKLVPSPAAIPNGGAELNDVLIGDVISSTGADLSRSSATAAPVGEQTSRPNAEAHPYAGVRVWRARASMAPPYGSTTGSHWFYVAQDQVPAGAASLFALGQRHHAASGVPTGVIEGEGGVPCLPSTACSVHPSDLPPSDPPRASAPH